MRFIISEWHKLKISSRLFTNKIRNPKNRELGKRSKDKGQRNKVETWNNGKIFKCCGDANLNFYRNFETIRVSRARMSFSPWVRIS